MSKSFRLVDLPYLREFAGISRGELARKLKVGVRDIERWEASGLVPQGAKMRRLRHWIASQLTLMENPGGWLRGAKKSEEQNTETRSQNSE